MKYALMAAAVAAAFSLSTTAHAQYNNTLGDVTPTNVSVRAGVVYAADRTMRQFSNFWMGAGVDYNLPKYFKDSDLYLSLDWLTHTTNGGNENVFPLCLNVRFPLSHQVNNHSTYAFLGAGAFFDNVYASQSVIGARGGLGVNLGPNIFAEATVYLSSGDQSYHTSGVGVYLGYRF